MKKIAVRTLKATVGIQSNRKELLPHLPFETEVKSLLTDFHRVEKIPFTTALDGYVFIENTSASYQYTFQGEKAFFKGPFITLEKKASDQRFTFWGNQGYLYRYTLYLLEKKHNIYNLHACALFDEDQEALYIIMGGAGSGKTVFLLSGIEHGLRVFSTETVHFQMKNKTISWYMGSLVDNIRWGTLLYDFPRFIPKHRPAVGKDAWLKKIAVDLSDYKTTQETIENPQSVFIFFPRVERGFSQVSLHPITNINTAVKALFDNISEKLSKTILLYDTFPVLGLDEYLMAQNRLQVIRELISHGSILQIASIQTTPKKCWSLVLK